MQRHTKTLNIHKDGQGSLLCAFRCNFLYCHLFSHFKRC